MVVLLSGGGGGGDGGGGGGEGTHDMIITDTLEYETCMQISTRIRLTLQPSQTKQPPISVVSCSPVYPKLHQTFKTSGNKVAYISIEMSVRDALLMLGHNIIHLFINTPIFVPR